MQPQVVSDLYQDVLPWLLAKRDEFLGGQSNAAEVSTSLVEDGIMAHQRAHGQFLRDRQARIEHERLMKIREEEATLQRRAERAKAREKRAKDEAKEQLRAEVRRMLIEKATIVSPAASAELLDTHGCFERGKQFAGAQGGQLMQWYWVLNAIYNMYPESDLKSFYDKMKEDPK